MKARAVVLRWVLRMGLVLETLTVVGKGKVWGVVWVMKVQGMDSAASKLEPTWAKVWEKVNMKALELVAMKGCGMGLN
jgi:hypothetical protein